MSDDYLLISPESDFNDISVEDNTQWVDMLMWDNIANAADPRQHDEEFVPACLGCSELSYSEAITLGEWLVARGKLGLRRERAEGEAA